MAKGMSFKVLLELQAKEFQKGINSIKKQLNGFGRFVKNAFALGSITMFGKQMVQVGKDFEDAMARVQAVSNATTDEFKKMQAEAQKLGSTTRYTATEAAGALENLTRNGMSATNAAKSLSSVLELAQANSISLSDAANILTNTLNMFNLSVAQAGRVNDVLSSTASHAATDITSLYEAMVNAAPAANVLGFSIEEVSAAIGALAQRGVKGSEAGTKLRIAFQKMADPKVVAKMKEQGIEIDENTMKTEGLLKTVEKLGKADLSLGQLGKIFDAKSAMAIQMLTASFGDLQDMLEVTANSAGETSRMMKQSVGSVQKELDTLKSKYEGLLISISQKTSGAVKSAIKLLQNLIGNFETVGGTIMNLASVVVPLLTKRIITLGTTIRTMFTQAAAGAATLKAAMGGIVTVVATLVTWIGTALVGAWNRAHQEIRDANKQMAEAKAKANELQVSVARLKEKIGDGSDKASLTSALKEATKLFPEFASAINDAKRIAAATGEWDRLKNLLQDIADLQSLVVTREAKSALANAKARKIGNQMYNDSAPLNMNPEVLAAQDIRKAFKDAGFTKDEIRDRFTEIARIIAQSDSGEKAYNEIKDYLDSYEIKVDTALLADWVDRYRDTNMFPDDWEHTTQNGRNNMSGLQQTIKDISTIDSTVAVQNYKIWKDHFDQQEDELRKRLGDVSKHQKEFNDEMAKYVKELVDKTIDGLPEESNEYKELASLLKAYPMPSETRTTTSETGGGSSTSTKAEKTNADHISDAIKDYNDAKLKLDNRLAAGTITTEDYTKELKALEDRTWETITAISDFESELEKLGQTALGTDLQNKYNKNRVDEGASKIAKQLGALGAYSVPTQQPRDTKKDYKKTDTQVLEETVKLKFDYKEGIENLIQKLQSEIEAGDFDLVKEDAIDMLENLKQAAKEAADEADTLEAKLDLSEAVSKLDDEIKSLSNTSFNTFNTVADVFDRLSSSLMSIAQVFDEDLQDSPFFKAFQAFNSVMNSSIQIMEAIMSVIELQRQLETKAAMEKVKNTAMEVAANKSATASEMEKAAASAGAAAAGGAASVASIPYVGPALAVAAAASIAAAILAAMSKFAGGGIVGGNSLTGDHQIIRANSGELVLNKQQQATLFNAIKTGNLGGGGNVQFKIRGCDLVGAIENEQSRRRG